MMFNKNYSGTIPTQCIDVYVQCKKKTFYIPLSQKKDWPYSNKVGTPVTLGPSTAILPMNAIQKRTTLST